MKKKGFTIIELLATILLLAIIITIAVNTILVINKKVREKQKDNLIEFIYVAAETYYNNTKVDEVYVDTLIKEGLLTSDDNTGNIYNPVDNSIMNCYLVVLKDGKNIIPGNCDDEEIADALINIKYCEGSSCIPDKEIPDIWLNTSPILLGSYSSILDLNPENTKYEWISPLAPDIMHNGEKLKIETDKYVNGLYRLIVTKNNKEYKVSKRIKIDVKEPYLKDLIIEGNTLKATLYDNESGLDSYVISTSSVVPDDGWVNINGKSKEISKNLSDTATYYVWFKDVAGNLNYEIKDGKEIGEIYKIEYKQQDTTPPRCVYEGESTNWTNFPRTIKWGCEDDDSGCETTTIGSKEFSTTQKTYTVPSYTIYDKAGNRTYCPSKEVDVYVDTTPPHCTITGPSSGTVSIFSLDLVQSYMQYPSAYVTTSHSCSDDDSGVSEWASGGNWTSGTSYGQGCTDKAGNTSSCNAYLSYLDPTCYGPKSCPAAGCEVPNYIWVYHTCQSSCCGSSPVSNYECNMDWSSWPPAYNCGYVTKWVDNTCQSYCCGSDYVQDGCSVYFSDGAKCGCESYSVTYYIHYNNT